MRLTAMVLWWFRMINTLLLDSAGLGAKSARAAIEKTKNVTKATTMVDESQAGRRGVHPEAGEDCHARATSVESSARAVDVQCAGRKHAKARMVGSGQSHHNARMPLRKPVIGTP
ncbi:hypothetical protein ACFQ2A_19500 [Variovorax dokdonensis]